MAESSSRQNQHSEQIVGECILKCVNVILSARQSQTAQPGVKAKSNRWFQLEVDDNQAVRNSLEQACRGEPNTPVDVEVYCCPAGRPDVVLVERWRIVLDSSWPLQPYTGSTPFARMAGSSSSSSGGGSSGGRLTGEDGALYKRLTLLVRTLCCHLRVLPTHRLVRAYKRQPIAVWRLVCKVSKGSTSVGGPQLGPAGSKPASQPQYPLICRWCSPPVPALGAGFRVGVEHISPEAVAALEAASAGCPALPTPQRVIIPDYVDAAAASVGTPGPAPRSPLPSSSLPSKVMSIPQPAARPTRNSSSDAPSPAASLTPGASSLSRSNLPRPSVSPVVRQSWGRKAATAANLLPPPSPVPLPPAHASVQGLAADVTQQAGDAGEAAGVGLPLPAQDPTAAEHTQLEGAVAGASRALGDTPSQQQQQQQGAPPPWAARSVSTPADVARASEHAAAAAAATGAPPTSAHLPPTAPVHIPGAQPRVRSFADIHVVYNFPDNPAAGLPPAQRARGLASSSTLNPSHLVPHTPGSAPAAPRGMLGQALEAHLARLKAKTTSPAGDSTSSGTKTSATATPEPVPPLLPFSAGGSALQRGEGPPAVATQVSRGPDSTCASSHPEQQQQQQSGENNSVSHSAGTSEGGGHSGPLLKAMPMPQASQGMHAQVSRQSSWRHGGSGSPQLPFAFTPAAHSMGLQSRLAPGTSVPASPSWGSMPRTPSVSQHHHHQWPHAAAGRHSHNSRAADTGSHGGSMVISGRDVTPLALARRPSWIEHSARVGRSNSTSGEASPSGDQQPHSLGAGRHGSHMLPPTHPQSGGVGLHARSPSKRLPAGHGDEGQGGQAGVRASLSSHSSPSVLAPAARSPQALGAPPTAFGSPPGVPPAPTVVAPAPQLQAVGTASWLQAPRTTTPLSATALPGMWRDEEQAVLAAAGTAYSPYSPPDLPPLMTVTVALIGPEGEAGAGLSRENSTEHHTDDDLPFLLDVAEAQQQQGGMPAAKSWVQAIKPLCQAGIATDTATQPAPPQGGIVIPGREVAVGVLLQHLQSWSASPAPAADKPEPIAVAMQTTRVEDDSAEGPGACSELARSRGPQEAGGTLGPGGTVLTCGAALEQLSMLQAQLDSMLSYPAA